MTVNAGSTALYRLFDSSRRLLYVGISTQPETRWTQHATDKPWWALVQYREVEWHADRKDAEEAERAAIRSEGPLYNTAGAIRSLLTDHFPVCSSMTQAQVRLRFSDVLDATQFHGQPIEVTRRSKPAGVIVPPDWFDAAVAALAEVKELRRQLADARKEQV
ncbi:type II toxin-antitoxin system prevent-host-death family antitoxin [Streptomyces sp. SID8499]|uniref:type II toxin-antitoxin system prevent-host-death family antitoxin n=1 Tax=Streptomyces sp. SID8499 TaxID=2706106 RepID=UPI0013C83432|nr:type II toxin-antitoxin system prevent-host-death family antitoxin [Streptomyces sp. SID8499]NED31079.1 type II toxin-antitoxin system prevent-host-death family antitoxin [Streptomyces sp. SID8499]